MRRSSALLVLTLILISSTACSGRAGGAATSASSSATKLVPAWDVPLEIGGEIQIAAAGDGFAAVSSRGVVMMIAAADGSTAWKADLGAKVSGQIAITTNDCDDCANPEALDSIAVPLEGGAVAFLPAKSGAPITTWSTGSDAASIVAVGGDTLALSPDGMARLYSVAGGTTLWQTHLLAAAGPRPSACADVFVIGLADGRVVGLDRGTGKIRWKQDLGSPIAAAPACHENHAFVATADNVLHALRIHKRHAGIMWRIKSGADPAAPPIALRKLALLLSKDTFLYGFQATNGHLAFRVRLDRRPGPAAVMNDIVFVAGSHATRLDAFRLPTGFTAGGFDLPEGSRFLTAPAIAAGRLAIALARYGEETSRLLALSFATPEGPAARAR